VKYVIESHVENGAVVLDPFLGSGTSIVAAEQTGRLARGIEIAPKYVAVALERLEGLGLSPVLGES
jgi:DNA modification methylase